MRKWKTKNVSHEFISILIENVASLLLDFEPNLSKGKEFQAF